MHVVVVAGIILALLVAVAVLAWVRWRAEVAVLRRRGERVECKLDVLLDYLALRRELDAIDRDHGRDD